MRKIFSLCSFLLSVMCYCQTTNSPVELTPAIKAQINRSVNQGAEKLKQALIKTEETKQTIEFALDTFRVEAYMAKRMEYNYSTIGMTDAGYFATRQYDSLMNKYYKLLLSTLKGADKNTLVKTQRAWLAFRNTEMKLLETMSKEEYSGGGSIQQLIDSSAYLAFVKSRVIALFAHYSRTFEP